MHLVKHTVRCASTRMDGIQLQETQLGEAHSGRMGGDSMETYPMADDDDDDELYTYVHIYLYTVYM